MAHLSTTAHLPRGAVVEVPPELLIARPVRGDSVLDLGLYDYVILGAGCAGLSAGVALVDAGCTASILLIDPRSDFRDDRTWCFWDVEPTPFTHLARGRWNSWQVRAPAGRADAPVSVHASAPQTPYLSIAANDFYRDALDRLAAAGTVALLSGEAAEAVFDRGDDVIVTTAHHTVRARQVVDARGLRMPPSAPAPAPAPAPTPAGTLRAARRHAPQPPSVWLPQAFVGVHIVTDRAVFDPRSCMLMDFAVDQTCGLRFMYVVPLSPTEALVENVFLTETALSTAGFVAGIELYLSDRFGLERSDYRTLSSEHGCIPMTDAVFDDRPSPRVTLLGTRGGATRPSTGYTFLRIQRSCRALVTRLEGQRGSHPSSPATSQQGPGIEPCSLLDAIFLRFLTDHPERAPQVFTRMFAAVDPAALVRFLSDQSDWRDNGRLILALPKRWFLAAAARVVLARVGHVAR